MSKGAANSRTAMSKPVVACFGEVLWDCLPRGLFLGGAPINAAYHLARQGLRVVPVTAVGPDFLGEEALRRVANWGVDTRFIARLQDRPTGTVRAALDDAGVARYEIARRVAWDRIPVTPRLRRLSPAPAAIVHGTLALREPANRAALDALFAAWPGALRVVDLNFRPPFDTPAVTNRVLRSAQLLKLNDEELARLAQRPRLRPAELARAARDIGERYGLARICVTAGARGAGLLWDGAWFWEKARPIEVRDTVGAGDAFLGGLLGALLAREATPAIALRQACRLGEFVASQDGATPDYDISKVLAGTA